MLSPYSLFFFTFFSLIILQNGTDASCHTITSDTYTTATDVHQQNATTLHLVGLSDRMYPNLSVVLFNLESILFTRVDKNTVQAWLRKSFVSNLKKVYLHANPSVCSDYIWPASSIECFLTEDWSHYTQFGSGIDQASVISLNDFKFIVNNVYMC